MKVKPDAKGAALLLLIGLFFTVMAFYIPKPIMMQDVTTTPRFFPLIVASIFSFFALIQLVVSLSVKESAPKNEDRQDFWKNRLPAVWILVLIGAYIVGMQVFGWLISSFIMVCLALKISAGATGKSPPLRMIFSLALLFSACVFIIFDFWLDVPLPRGFWSIESLMGM